MTDPTGTDDSVPATPFTVPPRGATRNLRLVTGTSDTVPATALVVPPRNVWRIPAGASAPASAPRSLLPATSAANLPQLGTASRPATAAALLMAAAVWLRRRNVVPSASGDQWLTRRR